MIRLTQQEAACWESIVEAIIDHEIENYDPPGPRITDRPARAAIKHFVTNKAIDYLQPLIEVIDD